MELADGHTGCGQVIWDGCLFAWNLGVTGSAVLMEAERRIRPSMTLSLHQSLITTSLSFENSTCQKPCTALYLF